MWEFGGNNLYDRVHIFVFMIAGLLLLLSAVFLIWLQFIQPWVVYIVQLMWINAPLSVRLERLGILLQCMAVGELFLKTLGKKRFLDLGERLKRLSKDLRELNPIKYWLALFKYGLALKILPAEEFLWWATFILWCVGMYPFWRPALAEGGPLEGRIVMILLTLSGGGWTAFMAKWLALILAAMLGLIARLVPSWRTALRLFALVVIFGNILEFIATFS